MEAISEHERRTYERVSRELDGKEHVPTCPARSSKPGMQCSDRCAVVRCVHRSIAAKIARLEALDKRTAGD